MKVTLLLSLASTRAENTLCSALSLSAAARPARLEPFDVECICVFTVPTARAWSIQTLKYQHCREMSEERDQAESVRGGTREAKASGPWGHHCWYPSSCCWHHQQCRHGWREQEGAGELQQGEVMEERTNVSTVSTPICATHHGTRGTSSFFFLLPQFLFKWNKETSSPRPLWRLQCFWCPQPSQSPSSQCWKSF